MNFQEAVAFIDQIAAISIMTPDERQHLWDLASDKTQTGYIVEVGCSHGGTSILLALAAQRQIVAIDNGQSGQIPTCMINLKKAGVDSLVRFIIDDSVRYAQEFPDLSCSMVIVDADHEGSHPYEDIVAWSPKVQRGGYLLIDDTACNFPQVSQAVFRFLCENHDYEYVWGFQHPEWTRQIKLLSLKKRV